MEEAPPPGERRPGKPCVLLRNQRREQHGVAASSLEELRTKARDVLSIDESLAPVTLVLVEDGTIVDDDDYFLCLPSNTKFVALACGEKWTHSDSDGGTAWISQESFEADETDSGAGQVWRNVARQLREDLSSIILLSEEDLQVLIDAPCTDLARELRRSCASVQGLQSTLQRVLDQREEARQSTQLLALYLQALEREDGVLSGQRESASSFGDEPDAGLGDGPSNTALASRVLATLQGKPVPELSLSSQDLELVTREDPQALATALNWDREKTETVQQACCQELALRLQQIQSWRSLRDASARKSPPPGELQNPKRAKPNPS